MAKIGILLIVINYNKQQYLSQTITIQLKIRKECIVIENLRIIREKRNKNQLNVAVNIGVSQSEISAYEAGRRYPPAPTLIKLAKFLETSTDYLLGLTNDSTPIKYMNKDKLTSDELKILDFYVKLAVEDKINFIKYIDDFMKKQN